MVPQRGTVLTFSLSPTLGTPQDPHYYFEERRKNNKKKLSTSTQHRSKVHRPSEEVNGGLSADDAHARVTIINTITRRHHDRMKIAEQFRAVSREIEKSGYK